MHRRGGGIVATRRGLPTGRTLVFLVTAALAILIGSKLLYLLEARFLPNDDYVPPQYRGHLHGFRIPGGIVLLAFALPIACRVLRLPWRRTGDLLIPFAALALVFIRLGCFLNSCCFGKTAELPWALQFPRQSWVFWYQRTHGLIPETADLPLPVHPLQLYFAFARPVWSR